MVAMDDVIFSNYYHSHTVSVISQLTTNSGAHHHIQPIIAAPCISVVVPGEHSFHPCLFESLDQALSDALLQVEVVILFIRFIEEEWNVLEDKHVTGGGLGGSLQLTLQPDLMGLH